MRTIDGVKTPRWFPHPAAWASAVALFLFAGAVTTALAFVMPILMELMQRSPRLGWMGMLAAWVSPIWGAAAVHRVSHGILSIADKGKTSPSGGWESLWAGFVAWVAIIFVTFTTSLVMLVLHPPPVDPDALWNLAGEVMRGASGGLRAGVWIVIAAYVYQLERASQNRG
jgi:hypothetical protein